LTQTAVSFTASIYFDANTAGHGWFIDAAPAIDEESIDISDRSELTAIAPAAVDRIDLLLTVIEHELGHIAGVKDLDATLDTLMSANLPTGTRRSPGKTEVDTILASDVHTV
jgi:hypothetical protein